MSNKTPTDAYKRVIDAKTGAHTDATDTYLVELRRRLLEWVAQIDAILALRLHNDNKRQAAR